MQEMTPEQAESELQGREMFFRRAFAALGFNKIRGDYLEFGCCGAITFRMAYTESRRYGNRPLLWAFDSFQGLPPRRDAKDDHPNWIAGHMTTGFEEFLGLCQAHGIPAAEVRAVRGYYDDSIGKAAADDPALPRDICLAYIDCDLYSSTQTVLRFLGPRLKHGMIVAFDDYFCMAPNQIAGERRALAEFLTVEKRFRFLPYMQFGWHGMSFMLEDRRLMPDDPIGE